MYQCVCVFVCVLLQDADAAYQCCCDYREPTCVIVKHTNPCGIATRGDLKEAYRLAVRADPISAFGGIVAFNRVVDADLAREIREFRSPTDNETRMFYEIVIAPGYTPDVSYFEHYPCILLLLQVLGSELGRQHAAGFLRTQSANRKVVQGCQAW